MSNLTVVVSSSSEVIVSWSPVEEPNGIIVEYRVVTRMYEGEIHTDRMVDVSTLNTTITGLGKLI